MSGNNLFMKRQARTIDLLNELENTATPFIIHQTEVDMETEFDYSCNKINGNKLEDELEDIVVIFFVQRGFDLVDQENTVGSFYNGVC